MYTCVVIGLARISTSGSGFDNFGSVFFVIFNDFSHEMNEIHIFLESVLTMFLGV